MATNSYIGERSLAEIVQAVVRDVGEVVRGEVKLAKAEVREKAAQASKSGVLFGGAALCGLMGFGAVVAAAIAALAIVLAMWASALIIGAFLIAVAAAMYVGARAKLKEVTPVPERTVQTLRDDVEWAKHPTK